MNSTAEKSKSLPLTVVITALLLLCTFAGFGFFRQLSLQSRIKENRYRAGLIQLEALTEGRFALCNRDDRVGLLKIRLKSKSKGWLEALPLAPLPASGCTTVKLDAEAADLVAFHALWETEPESRWNEEIELQAFNSKNSAESAAKAD